jgi:hypothetical protein
LWLIFADEPQSPVKARLKTLTITSETIFKVSEKNSNLQTFGLCLYGFLQRVMLKKESHHEMAFRVGLLLVGVTILARKKMLAHRDVGGFNYLKPKITL